MVRYLRSSLGPLLVAVLAIGLVTLAFWQVGLAAGLLGGGDEPPAAASDQAGAEQRETDRAGKTHKVKRGETLGHIADRYGVSRQALAAANELELGDHLYRGQELKIPSSDTSSESMAAMPSDAPVSVLGEAAMADAEAAPADGASKGGVVDATDAMTEPVTAEMGEAKGGEEEMMAEDAPESREPRLYEVEAGDSIFSIAKKFDVDPDLLAEVNGIRRGDFLYKGETLVIPTGDEVRRSDMPAEPSGEMDEAMDEPIEGEMEEGMSEEMDELPDLVELAIEAGDFTTLVAALEAAGLADELQGEGPFTVFAPTDAAFAALPKATLDELLADPSGDLTQTLLYHVVAGEIYFDNLSDGLTATTLQGDSLTFNITPAGATVNGLEILFADLVASNGVIHVIDGILMPPAGDVSKGMTETEMMTETVGITDTAAMTETGDMTGTEEITAGDDLTTTFSLTDTFELTDTVEMTDTESMTETGDMMDSESMTETLGITDTVEMTGTAMMTETEGVTVGDDLTTTFSLTDTFELTDTTGMTDTESMTETGDIIPSDGVTETEGIAPEDPDEDPSASVVPTEEASAEASSATSSPAQETIIVVPAPAVDDTTATALWDAPEGGIELLSPVAGGYHSPVEVVGLSQTFEGNLLIVLAAADGTILAERTTAGGTADSAAFFHTSLRFTVDDVTPATLNVVEIDLADGIVLTERSVELVLLPGQRVVDVTTPVVGQTICDEVLVSGYSNTFEANVVLTLRDQGGAEIEQLSASGGTLGTYRDFVASFTTTVDAPTPLLVSLHESDASGRFEQIDATLIPITLYPAGSAECS